MAAKRAKKGRGRPAGEPNAGYFHQEVARCRKALVERALKKSGGNMSEAARILEISRQYVFRLIEEHGIPLPERS